MKRFFDYFLRPGFYLILFGLAVVLYNWPILTIPDEHSLPVMFGYLFSCWLLLILVLFLAAIARSQNYKDSRNEAED